MVVAALVVVPTAPTSAAPTFELDRVSGPDRIATAVAISQHTFPGGADAAVLVQASNFPDGLAGTYLAGYLEGPVLLSGSTSVPAAVLAELDRLGVATVHLVGGQGSLDEQVREQLVAAGHSVERISGPDRYATSAAVATTPPADYVGVDHEGRRTAIVGTGEVFADVLAAGPLSYASAFPIILTSPGALHPEAAGAIADLDIEHVIVLGGTAAVSTATVDALTAAGVSVERISGPNRFETAAALGRYAVDNAGFQTNHVNLVTGRTFPDALASGPHGGVEKAISVLVGSPPVAGACELLGDLDPETGHVIGGTAAIDTESVRAAEVCGGATPTTPPPAGGGGGTTPPPPPPPPPSGAVIIARVGYTERVTVTYEGDQPTSMPTAAFDGDIEGIVDIDWTQIAPGAGGINIELPLEVLVTEGPEATLEGTITLNEGDEPLGDPLEVTVHIVVPDADTVPEGPVAPSDDDIVEYADGQRIVAGQIIVGVDLDHPNPNSVATAVANAHGGAILGSIGAARLYQLYFDGIDPDGLEDLLPLIEAQPGVEFAALNLVTSPTLAEPNDPWGTGSPIPWEVATPDGNNWGAEYIDLPGAWDLETGSSSTRIGIIDLDIDANHGDIEDNVGSTSGRGAAAGGHGTHVAGTACAQGDNALGITGASWDCELNLYGIDGATLNVSALNTAQAMLDAAAAGNRVVNMSLGFVDNTGTCSPVNLSTAARVEWNNNVLRRPILWALQNDHDVLWVFAAGNECRDASLQSPASLVAQFPSNTIAVAAIGRDGNLATFSNRGDLVTVAAPGVDVLSTLPRTGCIFGRFFCDDAYGFLQGTSMAAPQVAGVAGLSFSYDPTRTASQVKSCILASAIGSGADVPGHGFNVVHAPSAVECEGELELPPMVDVVLNVDLSGSMGDVLYTVQNEIVRTIDELRVAAPSTDFRFAVTSFEDYRGYFDSRSCGSTYNGTYGSAGDEPFRLNVPLSSNPTVVQDAVNGLYLGNGSDSPESYGRALWEIAQADTGAALGFRPGALKLAVTFGDDVPHDPNIDENVVDGSYGEHDTGIDPGRNGVIDCGGDDVDFQDDALADMVASDVKLLFVDSSWGNTIEPYWRSWAATTGGGYTRIDGSRSLTDVMIELLGLIE